MQGETRGAARLGPYRIQGLLGEGGMGVVHLGLDPTGRAVAVKVLRAHVAHDPDARARLAREVVTLRRVRHPLVAEVLDADVDGAQPYVVTRFVPGPGLDAVVRDRGPLPPEALVRLGRGLLGALGAIHAAGVVHRDLKPGNVLLQDDDPVVIDFGIAHVADDVRLTSVGLVMGTPGYLSPEVVDGGDVSEATDWWGWAATLAFAASGRPPFGRGPMDVVLDRVRRGASDLGGVDPRLRPLLQAALAVDPRRRPSARAVLDSLERYAGGREATVVVPAVPAAPTRSAAPAPPPDARALQPTPARGQPVPPQPAPPVTWLPAAASRTAAAPAGSPDLALPTGPTGPTGPSGPVAEAPGEPGPAAHAPARRPGTVLALWLAASAAATRWPLAVLVVAAVWLVTVRTADLAVMVLAARRAVRGRRRAERVVVGVRTPWYLVRSVLVTALGALLPVPVGVATAFLAATAAGPAGLGGLGGLDGPGSPVASAAGVAAGLLVAWWGPLGVTARRGTRRALGVLAPRPLPRVLVPVLLLLAVAAAAHGVAVGRPDWAGLAGVGTTLTHR